MHFLIRILTAYRRYSVCRTDSFDCPSYSVLGFRRLYEDDVLGKVTNEQFRMLSDGYNNEQREITERLPIVKQEIENLKAAATNVERFVDIANKYTDLRELTPEVLRTFIERIIIHERTAKHSKTASQQIDIYFRYIGKLAPEQVA